ncbi:serine hydrolase [Rhizobacter sp. OV335]|uniref:serine hydrolase domain-containing protein n=1 Tax=Rhizobacter sp. OV335 TaxID=1500264 RepID=UPI000912FEDF|nr:serine hydrolase domain-containing protein [Rhizobacter sp. OV335]SHM61802.1 CubicO group peptidase, beta-lactamase class C family [Rhizobacter sp. OV335]
MHQEISRRSLLKGAATFMALPAVTGLGSGQALAAGGMPGVPRLHKAAFGSIDRALQRAVDAKQVAGVVALGANDKGVIYEGAFGQRDAARGPAMSLDTVFWLLSMTKAVTATACMQLVEQGKLQLDEPVGKLLPDLASPKVLEGFDASGAPRLRPARRPITLRHLLTHTSGLTYSNWSDKLPQYEKFTGQADIAESKNGAFAAPLEFDPGERWQYGIGMDAVGKIVEAVSDQSLEVYFRENIFAPLGMTDTGFLISSAQRRRTATTYSRQADGSLQPLPFEMPQRPEFFSGGGGLFGTPRDYMAFLQMLVRDGTFRGARILKPETVAAMRHNQIGDLNVNPLKTSAAMWSNDADLFPGMPQKWGLSFDINTRPGPNGRSAGSISWAGLLNCYYWVDPVKRVTGTVFTQVLPFYDPAVVKLYGDFERGLYDGLSRT